jgi:hemin uptake protein HemP
MLPDSKQPVFKLKESDSTGSSGNMVVDKPATGVLSKSISSELLFAGARELVISHAGGEYRLRLTNQGKLILTK